MVFGDEVMLTLKMASAQDVETSVTNNSPSQDSNHPEDLFQSRYVTPGFKPFSSYYYSWSACDLPFIPSSRAAWIGVLPTSLLSLDTTVSAGWETTAQNTPAKKKDKANQ